MCVLGLLSLLGGVCIVVGAKIKKEVGLMLFFFKDHIRGRNDIPQMRIIRAVSLNLSIANTAQFL